VDDVVRAQLAQAGGELAHKVARRRLRGAAVAAQVRAEVAAAGVLEHEVEAAAVLYWLFGLFGFGFVFCFVGVCKHLFLGEESRLREQVKENGVG
jgi:hypothetical protein